MVKRKKEEEERRREELGRKDGIDRELMKKGRRLGKDDEWRAKKKDGEMQWKGDEGGIVENKPCSGQSLTCLIILPHRSGKGEISAWRKAYFVLRRKME